MTFSMRLDANWDDFSLAIEAVREAQKAVQSISDRMHTFVGGIFVHRSRAHPKSMLDAKAARELPSYTSLSTDRMVMLMSKESVDPASIKDVKDVLRRNFTDL